MAYEIPGFSFTLKASTGVVSTSTAAIQHRFVTANASGQATFPANGAAVIGVMTNKPTAENQAVTVVNDGIVKVEAAASTMAAGDLVAASSVGYAIVGSSNNTVVGQVIEGSSGSAGRVLTVLLNAFGSNSTAIT